MASLPARRPSQRRASPEQQSQPPASAQTTISPVRSRSEDSQTIFVHRAEDEEEEEQQQETADFPQQTVQQSGSSEEEPKKCWICYNDATETGPERGPWRDPCPCSLSAHEECLLDWIADMEANNRKGDTSIAGPKIECPQCKAEIKVARPRNFLVNTVQMLERRIDKLLAPAAVTALAGVLYGSCAWIGERSIIQVFGVTDALRILHPLYQFASPPRLHHFAGNRDAFRSALLDWFYARLASWRLYLGVPLITPVLILSRTQYADPMLPVLPVAFFASQVHVPDADFDFDFTQWPPSASFCFALVPYARLVYNFYYKQVWAEKKKRWLLAVQPSTNQQQAEGTDATDPANAIRDDENVFEVRIDGGIWDNEGQINQAIAENNAINNLPAQQEDEAAPGPDVADNRPLPQGGANEQPNVARPAPAPPQQQRPNNGAPRLTLSVNALLATTLGAIIFPTISSLSGDLLKLILPTSWTTKSAASRSLLQHKWARSLIGGCLFVVFKDHLMLYVRWRLAMMHKNRRIVDYRGRRGRVG